MDGRGCAAVFQCPSGPVLAWVVQLDAEIDAIELASLADPLSRDGLVLLRGGRRVLISQGLPEAAQVAALNVPERRFADLASYLAARPEVMERAARLRASQQ